MIPGPAVAVRIEARAQVGQASVIRKFVGEGNTREEAMAKAKARAQAWYASSWHDHGDVHISGFVVLRERRS